MAALIGKVKVDRQGSSVRDKVVFEAEFDGPPTMAEVAEAQTGAGYNPAGYDGPWGVVRTPIKDMPTVKVTWSCAASCD